MSEADTDAGTPPSTVETVDGLPSASGNPDPSAPSAPPSSEDTVAVVSAPRSTEDTLATVSGSGLPPAADDTPQMLGRFRVLRHLGSGAMGHVYLVEDMELGRQVALKLIGSDAGSTLGDVRRDRMLREARALAKVDHPNVVTVFDVGTIDRKVYIAMEFVPGQTLRDWLRERERSIHEILDVFTQAGRGLAAAHAVDLVHRDFKPDNALVGQDGRVRVVDFGLARANDSTATDDADLQAPADALTTGTDLTASDSGSAHTDPALMVRLTRTGAWMGTPAYMSPEQFRNETAGPHSDQFSFCVALFEALHGKRPFYARNVYELADNIASGKRAEQVLRKVPGWLEAAIDRGLAVDASARHPSMAALVEILDPHHRRARRNRWLALGGVVAMAGVVGFVARSTAPPAPAGVSCPDPAPIIAETWGPDRAAAVRKSFEDTGVSYAGSVADKIVASLDTYAEQWSAERLAACEATHVEHTQSEALLDLRTRCLDRSRDALAAVVTQLRAADEKLMGRAPRLVSGLPPLDECADAEHLEAAFQLPADPAARAAVEAAQEHLDLAAAQHEAGHYDESGATLEKARAALGEVEHGPILASILLREGRQARVRKDQDAAEKKLLEATEVAEGARHDRAAAAAWLGLIQLRSDVKEDADKAAFYLSRARASVTRLGNPPELAATLARSEGKVHYAAGDLDAAGEAYGRALELDPEADGSTRAYTESELGRLAYARGKLEEAGEHFARTVAAWEDAYGSDHPNVARALHNYGTVLVAGGKQRDALPVLERALTIRQEALGPDAGSVGDTLNALASVHYMSGDYAKALPGYEKSLAIMLKQHGPESPRLINAKSNIGRTLSLMGRHEEGIEVLQEAVELTRKTKGDDHPKVAEILSGLATAQIHAGHHADAEKNHRAALKIREAKIGKDGARTAESLVNLADTYLRMGKPAKALPMARRAVPILVKAQGEDHRSVAEALAVQGAAELALGKGKTALETLRRANTIAPGDEDPMLRAALDIRIAKALQTTGGDMAKARELATNAANNPAPTASEAAAEARAWLESNAG